MFLRTLTAGLLAATVLSSAAAAADSVTVSEPWARASAGMARAGGAFMTLTNEGSEPDALVSAAADVSEVVELHTHIRDGDVMKMREVEKIELAPGETVKLQPGGLHVMLIGLKAPLKEGESFPLTLTFEKAGETTVTVPVKAAGAMGAGGHMKHGQ